ncbi:hypothetical protein [Sediminibacillus albus]|uniref:Uncharacterized protein n=1 Tax=Sediminibacillus albus TaxID=407036 RepID=A0A1G9BD23_9BACI|nr:hypothetical protein [Sediminibacillus albus]SDK37387.1 hypothetical protein SAMN05216243_2956 [Sediminibacillus albus]
MDKQRGMWIPIIASVGIGAAAYYSMTKGNGLGKTIQSSMPMMAGMTGQGKGKTSPEAQNLF